MGKAFDLPQLDELLLFNNEEERRGLQLKDPRRQLIHQGTLGHGSKRKEYRVFLLDHALVITEPDIVEGLERLWVVNHPISIALLQVSLNQTRSTLLGRISLPVGETRYQLCFSSLGKRFNRSKALTLLSQNAEAANTWIETVNAQRDANQQTAASNVLKLGQDILQGNGGNKVNCAVPYNNGQTIAYGTDDGVYLQSQNGTSRKAINLKNVQQVDVLEDLSLLVILSERSVFTFPLGELEMEDHTKYMKKIASHTSFFKVGTCLARTMMCTVKGSSLSSTVKILEPAKSPPGLKGQTTLSKKEDKLKLFREFYLATELYSVQFLKTKLCAVAASRFEIVDLETLETQALLDPEDQKLKFTRLIEPHPSCMYRIGDEFLVCYQEFAFYVNSSGKKSDKDVTIYWEGTPTVCALQYPYIVGFSPKFLEIRHVDDGSLVQVILESDVRCLYDTNLRTQDFAYQVSRQRESNVLVSCANQVMFLTPTSS
ncbi:unnamed protein product [Rhizoctonia solani]|uniref:CNH domain-containing protein n=1 Tax=Rhizoctonia solani TaxID=456999 RepID=A0A8H3HPP9_9AGAM|nr:unnamed protein product [Rhizoctonia solani]